jgi:hypothetical protein
LAFLGAAFGAGFLTSGFFAGAGIVVRLLSLELIALCAKEN